MLGLSLAVFGFLSSWLTAPCALESAAAPLLFLRTQQACSCFGDFETHLPLVSPPAQFLILSTLAQKGFSNPALSTDFHARPSPSPSSPITAVSQSFPAPSHFVCSMGFFIAAFGDKIDLCSSGF